MKSSIRSLLTLSLLGTSLVLAGCSAEPTPEAPATATSPSATATASAEAPTASQSPSKAPVSDKELRTAEKAAESLNAFFLQIEKDADAYVAGPAGKEELSDEEGKKVFLEAFKPSFGYYSVEVSEADGGSLVESIAKIYIMDDKASFTVKPEKMVVDGDSASVQGEFIDVVINGELQPVVEGADAGQVNMVLRDGKWSISSFPGIIS